MKRPPDEDYEKVTITPKQQTAPDHVGWDLLHILPALKRAACAAGRWMRNQWRAQRNAMSTTKKEDFLRANLEARHRANEDLKQERDEALAQLADLKKQLKPWPDTEAEWVEEHDHLTTAAGAKAKDAEPDEHELPYKERQAKYAKASARPLEPLVAARPIGHQPPRRAWHRQERTNLTGEAPNG